LWTSGVFAIVVPSCGVTRLDAPTNALLLTVLVFLVASYELVLQEVYW
jgi:hypothetical protein